MNCTKEKWKRVLFSSTLAEKNESHKIAYIALMTALSVVVNMFEFKFLDNQFSLTITVALLTGIIIGSIFGFTACVLGDFIGFLINPNNMYMPWIGLSTGMFAFLAGAIFNGFPTTNKWIIRLKLFLICFLSFFICTIAINSTGFYFYNRAMGFSTAVLDYVAERFGGEVSFLGYLFYRLIFKGQIWNSLFNYALLFIAVPALSKVKPLGLNL